MFEKIRFKEHMEITTFGGDHLGTVDKVEDDKIKLTKSDSDDNMHHFLSIDHIDRIDDNRIYMKREAQIPSGLNTKPAAAL